MDRDRRNKRDRCRYRNMCISITRYKLMTKLNKQTTVCTYIIYIYVVLFVHVIFMSIDVNINVCMSLSLYIYI